jgi:hypothetical protein
VLRMPEEMAVSTHRLVVRFLYGDKPTERNRVEFRPESALFLSSKYFSYKNRTSDPAMVEISQFSLF